MKRGLSFVGESSQHSQEIMPYGKRTRKPSRGVRVAKIPRAIRDRGTPDGYYEIPVHSYTKIFFNGNNGFYDTNQTTGVIGALGGAGIGYWTSLDTEHFLIGGFGVYTDIQKTVPGFASIQQVFDQCKIAEIRMEYWFTTTNSAATTLEYAAGGDIVRTFGLDLPELWITEDQNNAQPGNSMDDICQYSKLKCIRQTGRSYKHSFKPHIRDDVGSSAEEAGTTTTLASSVPSTYIQTAKPGAAHMGIRGYFNVSSVNTTAMQGYLHIKTTQIRRYKNPN